MIAKTNASLVTRRKQDCDIMQNIVLKYQSIFSAANSRSDGCWWGIGRASWINVWLYQNKWGRLWVAEAS